jgi:hypothetical protein
MMHDKIVAKAGRWFGAVSLSLICGGFAACAGTDTPPVDDELEDAIAQNFTNGGVAAAGSAGSGNGGSGNTPAAGRGNTPAGGSTAAGGSGNTPAGGAPAAGGSAQEPPEEPAPSNGDACDGFTVLKTNCSGSSCHGAGGIGDFAETEEAALAFVGVSGSLTCAAAGPLLDPANPRGSVILQKVNGTADCGGDMPIGRPALSDTDVDCLEDWIGSL